VKKSLGKRMALIDGTDLMKQLTPYRFERMAVIEIQICGMYGADNLLKSTVDGWTLIITEPQPDDEPFEKYLVHRIYLVDPDKKNEDFLLVRMVLVD
jgi:hypothetical protein